MWIIGRSLILAERNSPVIYKLTSAKKRRYIYFISMLFSKRIVVQFPRYRDGYPRFLRDRITSIPNCVQKIALQKRSGQFPKRYTFAGRFSHQKRPIELIQAFSRMALEFEDVELTLFGEGELISEISAEILAQPAVIQKKIRVLPASQDINSILSVTDILCAPSVWEGFPNVVAESLSAGIPVIGFHNCDGLSDLISHRVNGWLANGDQNVVENLYTGLKESYVDYNWLIKNQDLIGLSVSQYTEKMTAEMWIKVTTGTARVLLSDNGS
jgi:GalNAc-alpha-(1->4)-GalNAc-alpha-(1->3)-diNAcBac-PP-undecaprenol alpha-1,4-N-acetyl-D-galactosaminyltransferase